MLKPFPFAALVAAAALSAPAHALILWADWQDFDRAPFSTSWHGASGTLGTATITYSGKFHSAGGADGILPPDFWRNLGGDAHPAYDALGNLPNKDYLGLTGQGQVHTFTFSETVLNPYILISSLGTGLVSEKLVFNDSFTVLDSGAGYHLSPINSYTLDGNSISGKEFNGVLQFTGAFDTLSFTGFNGYEWFGMNIGVGGLANAGNPGGPGTGDPGMPGPGGTPGAIPEPGTWVMLIGGFGMIGLVLRYKRRKQSRQLPVVYA